MLGKHFFRTKRFKLISLTFSVSYDRYPDDWMVFDQSNVVNKKT